MEKPESPIIEVYDNRSFFEKFRDFFFGQRCDICFKKIDFDEDVFMVSDELWAKFGKGREICLGCFEERLGRKITVNDLTNCVLNESLFQRFNSKI